MVNFKAAWLYFHAIGFGLSVKGVGSLCLGEQAFVSDGLNSTARPEMSEMPGLPAGSASM